MKVVLPMAGLGRRLKRTGVDMPKMLHPIAGRPMLYWALDSFQGQADVDDAVFVCLKQHLDEHPLEQTIYRYSPRATIIALDRPTRGQAETALAAAPYVNPDEALLIYNCDTYLESRFGQALARLSTSIDGLISVFHSRASCFSYVATDQEGWVIRTAEKEVISTNASTGLYHFSRARMFWQAVEAAMAGGEMVNGEYYVAPLYNWLIRKGGRFRIDRAHCCYPLGTPEQIQAFLPYADTLRRRWTKRTQTRPRGWQRE
ncbi:MAG: glycosyltransferase family 2 protein [Brevibacillus sp.]|nr:glycosyltransferase family 2 protein [Brevibacillus sp.]